MKTTEIPAFEISIIKFAQQMNAAVWILDGWTIKDFISTEIFIGEINYRFHCIACDNKW